MKKYKQTTPELFNIENPFYEKWGVGRPSKKALQKRANYWEYEKLGKPIEPKRMCNKLIVKTIKPK